MKKLLLELQELIQFLLISGKKYKKRIILKLPELSLIQKKDLLALLLPIKLTDKFPQVLKDEESQKKSPYYILSKSSQF